LGKGFFGSNRNNRKEDIVNLYENIVIINPSLSDEEIEAVTEKIKDLITADKGEILKVEPWGRRKLAYELNKQTRGFFVLLLFNAPSTVVKKLEDFYKVYDPVFKYMVVRLEKKQKEAVLKSLAAAEAAAATAATTATEAEEGEKAESV
jgi:small subunit ribosomal protein S6